MSEIKFPCPYCGQKIAGDESTSGLKVNCPHCQTALTVPDAREWQALKPQDIFIAYRPENGGEHLATLVREGLHKRRFEIFPDPADPSSRDDLPDITNLRKIELATDVIVILTPGCLDKCYDDGNDRLRREISAAIRHGKNIIPAFDEHFVSPKNPLPPDIADLLRCQGRKLVSDLWEESLNRLVELFNSKSNASGRQAKLELSRSRPLAYFAAVVALLCIFIGFMCFSQLNYFESRRWMNLVTVSRATLLFLFTLSGVLLVGAGMAFGFKTAGLKLIRSAASGLLLSNAACAAASIVAARGYGLSNLMASGPAVSILLVTLIPLVILVKLAERLLRRVSGES